MGDINNGFMPNDDIYQGIADRVRKSRMELGMSQNQFSGMCEIDTQVLSRVERGYSTTVENYCKIARYLNVPLDYIICGRDIQDNADNLLLESIDNLRRVRAMIGQ